MFSVSLMRALRRFSTSGFRIFRLSLADTLPLAIFHTDGSRDEFGPFVRAQPHFFPRRGGLGRDRPDANVRIQISGPKGHNRLALWQVLEPYLIPSDYGLLGASEAVNVLLPMGPLAGFSTFFRPLPAHCLIGGSDHGTKLARMI